MILLDLSPVPSIGAGELAILAVCCAVPTVLAIVGGVVIAMRKKKGR
ncbi:MAG: hypothetical protein IT378_23265 [Sandaracinaceae bacterium]|nr:hypothetical protein [Sandaracinaceae bacterium]